MESILESCLEECDSTSISQDIIETLLLPLTPSYISDSPTSHALAQAVLRRSTARLQGPLNTYLVNLMANSYTGGKEAASTNMEVLAGQLYPLIYELHTISPGLLVDVIPNICLQLQAEEEVRLGAVQVLGTLFSSEHANYGIDMNKYFKEFINRYIDLSVKVRMAMIETSVKMMQNKPELFEDIEGNELLSVELMYCIIL